MRWRESRVGLLVGIQAFAAKHGLVRVHELHSGHVTTWLNGCSTWNSTTKRNAVTALMRGFNWAVKNRGLDKNPIKGMEKPEAKLRTTVLTPEQFDKLLAEVKDQFFRDLLILSYDCGARPFEIKRLEARHVRWESEDPLGFGAGDTNVSRYVGYGTTNAIDPTGLDWLDSYTNWYNHTFGAARPVMTAAAEGVVVGAATAAVVVVAAPVAVAAGTAALVSVGVAAPAAAAAATATVTGTVFVAGTAGAVYTGYNTYNAYQAGNYNQVAYNMGTLGGEAC